MYQGFGGTILPIIIAESGGSMFLWNIGVQPEDCMAQQPRRPLSLFSVITMFRCFFDAYFVLVLLFGQSGSMKVALQWKVILDLLIL
jgi:hypothetical protein